MTVKPKYILEFYVTVGIPLLYFFVLYMSSLGGTIAVPLVFRLFGLVIGILGLIFWLISYLQLGHSFGVLPGSKKRVVTGLYARYKHPMYIGITLTFLGLSLANESVSGLIATTLLLVPVLVLRAKLEERQLS
jgi:protein-S-isoprenylcysteine O-methyltransferase Ste14